MKKVTKLLIILLTLCTVCALVVAASAANNTLINPELIFNPQTTLSVFVDGEADDTLTGNYPYGESATFSAPAVSEKSFQYWTNAEGTVISYSQNLTLKMYSNTTVKAEYGASQADSETVAAFLNVTRTDGEIIFNAIASSGNAGIRYSITKQTLDDLKGEDGVTVAPADETPNWALVITPENEDTTYYALAYTTVGTETTYSEVKAVKLSELQNGISMVTNLGDLDLSTLNAEFCVVSFDPNGGEGMMAPQGVVKGEATVLNTNSFTREGYTFSGWSTNKNGGGTTYTDGQSVTIAANTTLYAQWKVNSTPSVTPTGGGGGGGGGSSSSGSSSSSSSSDSSTTTTTTTKDITSNPDASTTNGTVTVTTTKNSDGSTTARTTETATKTSEGGSKTEVKTVSTTTTKSNTDGTTTATTTATETATTTAADGTKIVTENKTEKKETLNKSGNGTVEGKTTETVKDASGKVVATIVTESKGTVSTASDGTKTTTTTNTAVTTDAAGNTTTIVTTEKSAETKDGNTGKVVSDESGKVIFVEAKVGETSAQSAAKSGDAVTLPVTVTAAQSAAEATPVAITVPKDAESVKVEIPVENVKPGTVAVIVHEDGTEEIVKTSTTSESGVVLALESGASVKVVDNTKTFNDVSGNEWYAGNVAWASSREVMNGVGNNTFAPNADTSRAMVTKILCNLDNGKTNGAVPKFTDVSAGDWYAESVAWAIENGIARGEGASFGANDPVTREQLAVMLYNYAGKKGYDVSAKGNTSRFADGGRTSTWATDAMSWAVDVGILNGSTDANGNASLNPQGNASRAQVTAMTERFCEKVAK